MIITISDTCKNQPKRLDFDNTINLSSLIVSLARYPALRLPGLDGIPGLVPGLVPGIQGCKSPGSLGQTWDQDKSLKFILIDSIFLLSPCPETRCHARCFPVFFKDFSEGKNIYFETPSPGLPRGKADGGCNRVPLAYPEL